VGAFLIVRLIRT